MSDIRTTTIDTEEAAVDAALAGLYAAWAAGDADAFAGFFTPDATSILPGSLRAGREMIRDKMAEGFAGPLAGTTTTDERIGVRFLGDDAATVVSESGVLFPGQAEVPDASKVIATWVLEKQQGRWLIAAYHNCAKQVA